jgi:hypothetical protein
MVNKHDVAARAGFPASSIYVDSITPHIAHALAHPLAVERAFFVSRGV